MKLKTTTWKGRNKYRLAELKEAALSIGYNAPRIADIGVGGITHFLAEWLPEGPKEEMGFAQIVQRFFVRGLDNIARKYGFYDGLKNYELGEVQDIFSGLNPSEILIVDNDSRVLNSVSSNGKLRKLQLDICVSPLPNPADIIVCYNVLQISSNPLKALENLLNSVANGGLLSFDAGRYAASVSDRRYERLSEHLYRRHL